jgi:predicted murein hydrolase (TIGR00659 family)
MAYVLVLFTVAVTVAAYALTRRAFLSYGWALLSPVFLSTLMVIGALCVLRLPFEAYRPGQRIMSALLGPAVVALAVPLFRQRLKLIAQLPAVVVGIVTGSLMSLVSTIAIARLARLDPVITMSLAPKSVTAPIAVEIAPLIGGDPALTAAFVIATGALGSMIGPWFLSRIRITDPVARGLAVGTTAHGQGTAMMLHEGETQGALSGVAMVLAAIFTAFIAPIAVPWVARLCG